MAKKLKKKKTGMNPKVKFTLTSAFKGIISNQAVVDGSKESPWWVAAIFFVFAVIIPLIPGFVKINNTKGGAFIASANYGFDTPLTAYAYNMYKDEQELKVEKGILHYYDHGTEDPNGFETPDDEYIFNADDTYRHIDGETGQITLRVFLWDGLSDKKLKSYVNKVAAQKFVRWSDDLPSTDPEIVKTEKYYIPNIMVITPSTIAVALYKSNTTTQVATSLGGLDWKNFSTKVGLFEYLNKAGIKDSAIETLDRPAYINQYRTQVMKQMIRVFNNTYLNQKQKTLWANTGIYAGIYAGIILFLGLMVFILTRGKANPFKVLNIWHCQKIVWWASFTPAVLGMILAFVFSGNMIGQMAFILLISLRVMWLSMKQLRPVYQQ